MVSFESPWPTPAKDVAHAGSSTRITGDGRKFLCRLYGHSDHADCNVGSNIEKAGLEKLGSKTSRGQLKLRYDVMLPALPAYTGSAHVKGRLDVKGSCISSPEPSSIGRRMWCYTHRRSLARRIRCASGNTYVCTRAQVQYNDYLL